MVFESISEQFLSSKIRDGREGIQLQRTFRAISFLLIRWSTFTEAGDRKLLYGKKPKAKMGIEPMPVIHFEKFALLIARIWKKVYVLSKDKIMTRDHSAQGNDLAFVTFPFPFQEYPDKHGRRLRRINGNKKHVYMIQILYELLKEGIYYCDIETSPKDPNNPNNYKTSIKPSFPTIDNNFLQCFTPFEVDILNDLENSLKRLDASQIRALGTHENKEKTIYDIKKEFLDMFHYVVDVIDRLTRDDSFFDNSFEIMTYADEAWRKSTYNREDYTEARQIMINEINTTQLREAFEACQSLPDEIWETDEIQIELAKQSKKVKAFSKYLHAISFYRDNITKRGKRSSRDTIRIGHLWDEGLKEMNECGLQGFPSRVQDVFVGNTSEIKPKVCNQLSTQLESLRDWIKENTKHAQRELCLS